MTDILVIVTGLIVTAAAVGLGNLALELVMRLIRKAAGPLHDPPLALPVVYRDRPDAAKPNDVMRRAA